MSGKSEVTSSPVRLYGVSFGNGNDGVSHSHPDFYVTTDDPWLLARAAMLNSLRLGYYGWANEAMDVDGEADFTVSATLYEGPGGETEFGAAWLICEVFQIADGIPPTDAPKYDNTEAAFAHDLTPLRRALEKKDY